MRVPATGSLRRFAAWVFPSLLLLGVAGLDIGSAAPQDLTSNIANSVSTLVVAPPEDVTATSTLNLLPLLTCRVTVTWSAPTMADIGGYEVRRIRRVTGTQLTAPQSTTDLSYIDNPTPLSLSGNAYDYQVRTTLAGTTWTSEWVTADTGLSVLCLTGSNARSAGAPPDRSTVEDGTSDDDRTEDPPAAPADSDDHEISPSSDDGVGPDDGSDPTDGPDPAADDPVDDETGDTNPSDTNPSDTNPGDANPSDDAEEEESDEVAPVPPPDEFDGVSSDDETSLGVGSIPSSPTMSPTPAP